MTTLFFWNVMLELVDSIEIGWGKAQIFLQLLLTPSLKPYYFLYLIICDLSIDHADIWHGCELYANTGQQILAF